MPAGRCRATVSKPLSLAFPSGAETRNDCSIQSGREDAPDKKSLSRRAIAPVVEGLVALETGAIAHRLTNVAMQELMNAQPTLKK